MTVENADKLTIVTGASSNHFSCLQNLLTSLSVFEKGSRVIVYDLGLTAAESEKLRKGGWEVRVFEFNKYPPHLRITESLENIEINQGKFAGCCGWKSVVVCQILKEVGGSVLWLDAGDLVLARLDKIREQLAKKGLYSPVSAGSISDWTHPKTLQFLNASSDLLEKRNRNAAIIGLKGGYRGIDELAEEWKKASLDVNCISPSGSDWTNHRYEQSIFSVLAYQFQKRYDYEKFVNTQLDISTHNDDLSLADVQQKLGIGLKS